MQQQCIYKYQIYYNDKRHLIVSILHQQSKQLMGTYIINNNHTESDMLHSNATLVNIKSNNKTHLMSLQWNHIPISSIKYEHKTQYDNYNIYIKYKPCSNKQC